MNTVVKERIARRVKELRHEKKHFLAESHGARSAAERKNSLDRAAQCQDAIDRVLSGGKG